MTTATVTKTDPAPLLAEIKRLQERIKKSDQAIMADRRKIHAIEAMIHKMAIMETLGVDQGVCTRYRRQHPKFDGAFGTVTKVNRTRAVVDFGDLGKWRFLIAELLPAKQIELRGGWMPLP